MVRTLNRTPSTIQIPNAFGIQAPTVFWWNVASRVLPDSTLEWERRQILVAPNQNFQGHETKLLFDVRPSCCCEFSRPGYRKRRTQSAKTDPPGIASGQTQREDISEKMWNKIKIEWESQFQTSQVFKWWTCVWLSSGSAPKWRDWEVNQDQKSSLPWHHSKTNIWCSNEIHNPGNQKWIIEALSVIYTNKFNQ